MTAEQFIKAELAALCWREGAHLGGLDILLALGCVFRNRVRAGWRGGDWLEVIYSAEEYSSEFRVPSFELSVKEGTDPAWHKIRMEKANGENAEFDCPVSIEQVLEFADFKPPQIDLRDPTVRLFMGQVDDIFNGLLEDRWTVNDSAPSGALFYAELNAVSRPWFRENILARPEEHPRVAVVGNMTFFR